MSDSETSLRAIEQRRR